MSLSSIYNNLDAGSGSIFIILTFCDLNFWSYITDVDVSFVFLHSHSDYLCSTLEI